MKVALMLLSCTVLSATASPHPAEDALRRMQKMQPEEVKQGHMGKWIIDTLAKQEQPEAGKPHILVLGDSWADVVGMTSSTKGSFLMRALKSHGCQATASCAAIPATTASMWSLPPVLAAIKTVVKLYPDLYVYIMLVGNDALMVCPDCARDKTKSAKDCADVLMAQALPEMYKIVDAIHEGNPKARVTGFGYDTMFGAKGCGLISHDVFPQCAKNHASDEEFNVCFNTQFLRIQEAWGWIAGNRTFVDNSIILGATQVAGGDKAASTDPNNRHIDMKKMGPGKYWPLSMECFHPSVDNCVDGKVESCGAQVVMEEFYKNYWSKQSAVCPSAQSSVVV